jgi:hypothetical protein
MKNFDFSASGTARTHRIKSRLGVSLATTLPIHSRMAMLTSKKAAFISCVLLFVVVLISNRPAGDEKESTNSQLLGKNRAAVSDNPGWEPLPVYYFRPGVSEPGLLSCGFSPCDFMMSSSVVMNLNNTRIHAVCNSFLCSGQCLFLLLRTCDSSTDLLHTSLL